MEVLYAIISILFITAIITLLILMFRPKKTDPTPSRTRSGRAPAGTAFRELFGQKHSTSPGTSASEYFLEPGSPETVNDTMRDTALDVVITHVRDSSVHVVSEIKDTDALSREGVVIGREGCDYNMRSLLIDRGGTFLIKRIGDNYMLIANRNAVNGIRSEFRGEKKKKIEFVRGKATCYVGPIRFEFSVCDDDFETASNASDRASFYSDDTMDGTRAFSM